MNYLIKKNGVIFGFVSGVQTQPSEAFGNTYTEYADLPTALAGPDGAALQAFLLKQQIDALTIQADAAYGTVFSLGVWWSASTDNIAYLREAIIEAQEEGSSFVPVQWGDLAGNEHTLTSANLTQIVSDFRDRTRAVDSAFWNDVATIKSGGTPSQVAVLPMPS